MSETSLTEFVAKRIRQLREEFGVKGVSQEELAKGVGTTGNTISRWETGTYRPSLDDLERLARAFKVSILEFFPKEDADETEELKALARTAKQLDPRDLAELQDYANYRKARHLLSGNRPRRGRREQQT